jgi:hypothetical protein
VSARIAFIGAGSVEFPELADAEIALHDIDDERLEAAEAIARWTNEAVGASAAIGVPTRVRPGRRPGAQRLPRVLRPARCQRVRGRRYAPRCREEGSLGLIEVVGKRRLERELRLREAVLREAAEKDLRRREAALREAARVSRAAEQEPVVAKNTQRRRGRTECSFCGRRFHSYGQFLNHKCNRAD